ncbi:MAG: FAD-dependent oxidoreductase [Pirellulales bacterium]|nr:FAD-dependent oxidoreductase [Pirellulales bacterium]
MKRRQFLTAGALGALASVAGRSGEATAGDEGTKGNVVRQAVDVPVVERADVVVCGGGPAGVAAAVAAGRSGAKVRLIENQGFLGGVWTASMVNLILDRKNKKKGLVAEILAALAKTGAQRDPGKFDVEAMKFVLENLCLDAGVRPLYLSRVVDAVKDGRRVTHAIVENKSGRQALAAGAFIDATGDGDLAARAGCGFDWGHPVSGKTQPMSMIALLGGIHYKRLNAQRFVRGDGVTSKASKAAFLAELKRAGVTPSYKSPTLFCIREDHFAMMANHQYGASGVNAQQVTDATIAARAEIHRIVDALRRLGGVWRDLQLLATSPQIGVREARRIHGRYTLTGDDLLRGARFDDAVCRASFAVDVHALDPKHAGGSFSNEGVRVIPYDIPLRSLIAKDVDGLLMAGRCISGDFLAHASYRVTGNAVAMGEAAGRTAALAARGGRLPHEVGIDEIRQ